MADSFSHIDTQDASFTWFSSLPDGSFTPPLYNAALRRRLMDLILTDDQSLSSFCLSVHSS